jgi:cell division protein FtsL
MVQRKTPNKKNQNFFNSQFVLFFLILVLLWAIIVCVRITYKKNQMARESRLIGEKIEDLKKENQTLAALKSILNNRSYLEKEAKKRLNLKNEGEEIVMIPAKDLENEMSKSENEAEQEKVKTDETSQEDLEKMPNYKKWWIYFFNN